MCLTIIFEILDNFIQISFLGQDEEVRTIPENHPKQILPIAGPQIPLFGTP